jgi:hypothetical protein
MSFLLQWILIVMFTSALYILASGVAFVSVYRLPGKAPISFYGWFFAPLDWAARQLPVFGRAYNAFHQWCYRSFVGGQQ